MSLPLKRQDVPPPPEERIHVLRVKPGSPFHGQIVSDSLWGCWTHWDGKRTRECTQEPTTCHGCLHLHPPKWRAFLYVWNALQKQYMFLELTPDGAENLLKLAPQDGHLRGLLLVVNRIGHARGPLQIKVDRPVNDASYLPEAKDPEKTLRKLWGWTNCARK